MALQTESSAAPYSPQVVACAFVKQYYQTIRYKREDAYKFYNHSSILGRSDSDGNMISATTIDDIKTQLLSTDFTDCLIELETVDSQPSHLDGVVILVAGSFTIDAVKQKFTQSFFLAPQGSGYFVLNDMFRFARPSTEMKEMVANHNNESTQSATLPAEPETDSIKESMVSNIPPTVNIMPVHDDVISPSTNVVSQVVETCVKVANKDIEKISEDTVNKDIEQIPEATVTNDIEKITEVAVNKSIEKAPEATPAPPPAEKEVPKKTYASIVKTVRDSIPPAPAAKPNPRPKAAQNAEIPVSSPSKLAQATKAVPPSDKDVSKSKSSDEPGYSVFVKNLPFEATVEMVGQEFSRFGAIKPGGIQVRKHQLDRFCFGFVEFESQHSMEAAIEASTVYFGSWESYVEEKRTKTRVVDGVVTRGDDNGNGGGSRFQSDRGGYHGDSYRGQGGFRNNGYYHNGDNMRNDFRNQNGRGPQGNGYQQNGNGYQKRRPFNNGNGNGRAEHTNGPRQQTAAVAS